MVEIFCPAWHLIRLNVTDVPHRRLIKRLLYGENTFAFAN
jgi:hypothetical protein